MGFNCEDKDPETIAFLMRTSIECRSPISNWTMPLFGIQYDHGNVSATSELLQIGDKFFLLSAAHVFDAHHWPPGRIPLNVTDGTREIFAIGDVTLIRSQTKDPVNRFDDDSFDIAVCELPKATADKIASGGRFRFLRLNEIDPWGPLDPRDWFMVFGFPGVDNPPVPITQAISSTGFAYACFLYIGERGDIPLTQNEQWAVIFLDYNAITTRDDNGNPATPPDPRGMSGAGIWRLAKHGSDMKSWSIKDVKLVGIENSNYSDRHILRGTRIECALQFIYRRYRELQPVLDLHYGRDRCQQYWR